MKNFIQTFSVKYQYFFTVEVLVPTIMCALFLGNLIQSVVVS
jgi:hypothetical protein